jgi:uridine kinase
MKGDVLVIEEHHRRAAATIAAGITDAIRAMPRRFLVTVAGESGSGKSETAAALAACLADAGLRSVVLGQDDYFVLPPRSNDARRRSEPEWLGPHVEVNLDRLQGNLDAARAGAEAIEKPVVDYDANAIGTETVDLAGVKVVIAEGTYVSLLRHIDARVFIARSRVETLDHRRRRNRGSEAQDPFIEEVLDIEHKIIAGHRALADFVITADYGVVRTS